MVKQMTLSNQWSVYWSSIDQHTVLDGRMEYDVKLYQSVLLVIMEILVKGSYVPWYY